MPAPTPLAIATSSVQRLLKDDAAYKKEIIRAEERIKKQENEDLGENKEFLLKQERQALEETKGVILQVHKKIAAAVENLQSQLASNNVDDASSEEISKADEAIRHAQTLLVK